MEEVGGFKKRDLVTVLGTKGVGTHFYNSAYNIIGNTYSVNNIRWYKGRKIVVVGRIGAVSGDYFLPEDIIHIDEYNRSKEIDLLFEETLNEL